MPDLYFNLVVWWGILSKGLDTKQNLPMLYFPVDLKVSCCYFSPLFSTSLCCFQHLFQCSSLFHAFLCVFKSSQGDGCCQVCLPLKILLGCRCLLLKLSSLLISSKGFKTGEKQRLFAAMALYTGTQTSHYLLTDTKPW